MTSKSNRTKGGQASDLNPSPLLCPNCGSTAMRRHDYKEPACLCAWVCDACRHLQPYGHHEEVERDA
jgi:hypothetical protein